MTFVPTDERTLEVAIVAGILSISPSLERSLGWNHDPETSPMVISETLRHFFIQWEDVRQVIGGATGNSDYELIGTLIVLTHYYAAEPDQVGELVMRDHFDINRHFIDRLETIVGLTNWESLSFTVVDEEARLYRHQYDVSFMRV